VGHKSRKLSEIGALACLLIGMTGAMGAQAQTLAALPAPSIPAAAAGVTRPVQAWTQMCERQPAECAVDTGEQPTIALTRQTWQLLVTVNAKVNTAVKPLTDDDHWGVADLWSLPEDGYGDCEDYQLLKRQLLVEAGFPRRALLMTVVIDEKGEGHAVLMARTDRGDFILDNKVQSVLPWHQTGYIFVKREGQNGPGWTSLGGATSPVTTANR
jgi:predicted transglutaminase-like cysteine proteinase